MIASETKTTAWLSVAKKAALLAGEFLRKKDPANVEISVESRRDIKIAADCRSERIILDCLKENSDFSILSEEQGLIPEKEKDFIWVVDPLDGTFNYMRGIPLCAVSIGLWKGDTPVLGVVYDFGRSELFSGISEKGGWLNDRALKVSDTSDKKRAVLCTGFPVNTDFSAGNMEAFSDNARSHKKMRLLGSAALSICYVASGRADAYSERDIMFWDIAGGIPILLGAGG
ncbi:MAG: inositol monophosphatase, partial [Omnitrophica bacterium]|nr:inositol monophosphatase [Candidatus Omnitrophota bacterium]